MILRRRTFMFFLLAISVFGVSSWARDNTARSGAAQFQNVKTTTGLCTSDNKDQDFYKEGYCKSLYEAMTQKPCFRDLVEKLRLRYLGESARGYSDKKHGEPFELGIYCADKTGDKGTEEIAKDPAQFTQLLMNFLSMVVVKESDWDVKANKGRGNEGLMSLRLESMDDPKYECGCKVLNSKGAPGANAVLGESPGPLDGHHSIMCGAYQALYWADKDGVLYGGADRRTGKKSDNYESAQEKPKDERDGRRGAARVFKSLERNYDQKGTDQLDKWFTDKTETYCKNYAHRTGVFDADMTKDIGSEALTPAKRD